MSINFYDEAARFKSEASELRRWFHIHPEKSFGEINTTAKIRSELDECGIEYYAAGETGTVGIIRGRSEKPVIALRADIDALEITERNDVLYRSQTEGLMHACGHDAHAAALLTAAKILNEHKNEIQGTVKLIFQPAEEVGRGAQTIVDSGLIDDAEAIFGIHVRAFLPVGRIALKSGAIMGGANSLKIKLHGKGGHGGRPNQAVDALVAGAEVVEALQHIVSREISPIDPAVVSVCRFHSGTRDNIIANEAEISGTVRVLDDSTREQISEAVKRIVNGISAAHRVTADVECDFSTLILKNSKELYPIVYRAASNIISEGSIEETVPELGTEDFSVYGKIAPIFFAFVGSGGEYPHHSERFDIDEESISISAALYTSFVYEYLSE